MILVYVKGGINHYYTMGINSSELLKREVILEWWLLLPSVGCDSQKGLSKFR